MSLSCPYKGFKFESVEFSFQSHTHGVLKQVLCVCVRACLVRLAPPDERLKLFCVYMRD